MVSTDRLEDKECTHCGEIKPRSEYYKSPNRKSGLFPYCRTCHLKAGKAQRLKNPESSRTVNLRRRYGITHADYSAMLEKQGGVCAICGTDSPGRGLKHFMVDHNHDTGRVRALLCDPCNKFIGLADEDPGILRDAAAYLELHRNEHLEAP